MKSCYFFCFILCYLLSSHASKATEQWNKVNQSDSVLLLRGMVYSNLTNEPVHEATIFYEKLPYYDDMGLANANIHTGAFEVHLVKDVLYNVRISAEGFETFEKEMRLTRETNGDEVEKFYLNPDRVHQIISLNNLNFANKQSVISKDSYEELDVLSGWLISKPNIVIQLEGHTDFAGGAEANLKLSEERVEAVKRYMVKKGAKRGQVKTKAFGGTKPLTRDRSAEGKSMNRRVEVRILKQ